MTRPRPVSLVFTSFNVSNCGRFLMLANGECVSLYSLKRSSIGFRPIVRLACGGRVKAVSMDTSSGRFAVAVLLQHRVGVIFDLYNLDDPSGSQARTSASVGMHADISSPSTLFSASRTGLRPTGDQIRTDSAVHTLSSPAGLPTSTLFRPQTICLRGNWHLTQYLSFLFGSSEGDFDADRMPTRTQPTTIYNGLGRPDDIPRSVALCPQRQCVAFGCRMGIELHWVDALTGGHLNRWFPLAVPSDYLYFLPQRKGDTSKKLRLVSSAATPSVAESNNSGTTSVASHHPTEGSPSRRQSRTRLFFGSLPFPVSFPPGRSLTLPGPDDNRGVLRTMDCDHYRAVPLSDGIHILFTDPVSGMVCLGSDAPLGGPTKLLRKAVFTPISWSSSAPTNATSVRTIPPLCYSAAPELSWGARIVVAYNNGSVLLYNVPSDVFERVRHFRSELDVWDEHLGPTAQSDLAMDILMGRQAFEEDLTSVHLQPHNNSWTSPSSANAAAAHGAASSREDQEQLRSLIVNGRIIAQVDAENEGSVEDIAVDGSYGGLRIWLFLSKGVARCFDVYTTRDQPVRYFMIDKEGLMRETQVQQHGTGDRQEQSKGKQRAKDAGDGGSQRDSRHVHFSGLDGTLDSMDAMGRKATESAIMDSHLHRNL